MPPKLSISKPTYNVLTATGNQKAFDSDYDSLKAYEIGTTTLNIPAAATFTEKHIAHTLGYVPAFFALVQLSSGAASAMLPVDATFPGIDSHLLSILPSASTTELTISVNSTARASDILLTFKYYIFYNQID